MAIAQAVSAAALQRGAINQAAGFIAYLRPA